MSQETTQNPEVNPQAPQVSESVASDLQAFVPQEGGDRSRKRGGKKDARGSRAPRKKEAREFEETIIGVDRVTRVTAGGRQLRFRVTVAIGDRKGRVGFGIGKSSEVMLGVEKAIAQAKKRLFNVPIYQDTIPHGVNAKFKATKLVLMPAPEGKGVIAGGTVRKILDLAGVKNVLSKLHGSRNKITSAYVTMKALESLRREVPLHVKAPVAEKAPEEGGQAPKSEAPSASKKAPSKADSKKPAHK